MGFKSGDKWNGKPGGRKRLWPFTSEQLKDNLLKAQELVSAQDNWPNIESWYKALMQLITFQADRLYGKPAQQLDIKADKPLAAIVNIQLSDPSQAAELKDKLSESKVLVTGEEIKAIEDNGGEST